MQLNCKFNIGGCFKKNHWHKLPQLELKISLKLTEMIRASTRRVPQDNGHRQGPQRKKEDWKHWWWLWLSEILMGLKFRPNCLNNWVWIHLGHMYIHVEEGDGRRSNANYTRHVNKCFTTLLKSFDKTMISCLSAGGKSPTLAPADSCTAVIAPHRLKQSRARGPEVSVRVVLRKI